MVLHRWVGLTFGCILVFVAITGSLLVIAKPLDAALHPELFNSSGPMRAPLQPMVSRLRAEFGPQAAFNVRIPAHDRQSLHVVVSGPWVGTVFVDAATGQELGRRAADEGLFNTLFELHSSLYAGDTGRATLAGAALVYCLLLISGVVLWWPRSWKHAFAVRSRLGSMVAVRDLHRAAGAALGWLVLVSVVTGAYMAWRPLASWVTYLSGGQISTPPAQRTVSDPMAVFATIDAAVQRAREYWPEATPTVIHVPARSVSAARIRMRLPDDPHPIGMSTVWLDPLSGRVRQARRWSELEAGSRAFSIIYPLHSGSLFGVATLVGTFIAGVALAGFGCTGIWTWCQRCLKKQDPLAYGRPNA